MKLWEGNVFTGTCRVHPPSDLRTYPLPTDHPWHQIWGPTPPPITDIWWTSLETCSNLFTWGSSPTPPSNCYWHLVVATETLMVAKRSASILLECCRVFECKRGQLPKTVNINRSDRKNRGFTVPVAFGSWLVESELRSAQQTLAPAQPRYEAR